MPTLPPRLPATLYLHSSRCEILYLPLTLMNYSTYRIMLYGKMNYLVCTSGRYRSISNLERLNAVFFNYYKFDAVTYMPDEIFLVRMMTTLDLEFEFCITMMKGMRVTITMGSHPESQVLCRAVCS